MRNFRFLIIRIFGILACLVMLVRCAQPSNNDKSSKYLYVVSGSCYSGGGNTTFTNLTSSNLIYRLNTDTGIKDLTLADYNMSPSQNGDSPISIASIDQNSIYVLVENTTTIGARRIEKIAKSTYGARSLFSNNITALSAQLRKTKMLANGDLLISKSNSVEKITASNVRITKGAAAYINAPAAPCATSTTLISDILTLKNQYIVFLHAAAGQNRIGVVKPDGYAAAGDCSPAQAPPNANSFPVTMTYDSVNSKLIVAYAGSGTTTDINSIYVYNITETASSVTIGTANKIYDSSQYPTTYPYLLYGVSAMTLDSSTNELYIATSINTTTTIPNYAIEKFSYDPSKLGTSNTTVLTRVGTTPFYSYSTDTKCISDLVISN